MGHRGVQRLLRTSIRWKLLGACGGLALLTGVIGVTGLRDFSMVNSAFQTVAQQGLPSVTHLVEARREMERALVAERTLMFMQNDSPAAQEQRKTHDGSLAQVMDHWKAYASFAATEEEKKLWPGFEKAQSEWEGSSREVLKLLAQESADARKDAIDVSLNEAASKFEIARKVLANLSELRITTVNAQAKTEERRVSRAGWFLITAVLVSFGVAVLLSLLLARSIASPLGETVGLLKDIAEGEGDLARRLEVASKDELGELANWFNTFLDKLCSMMIEVKSAADSVTASSQQLSAASEQLSGGAQEQASSLEETAASLEEITGTVKQNADNARQANQLALGSRDSAEKGGQVVAAAVEAMGEINSSSKKIADIITTIDEIAFQTNLLALNAAVEAARAGEQGRGFAVVAAEVRNLAQRSARAAKEIKTLIQDSVAKVQDGSALVNKSGQTLKEIVTSVKRVTDIIGEIAAASQEQSSGIDQVNQAVAQMDQVVQSNAAQTEELTSTAQSLASQARQLQALVGRFKLDDGSVVGAEARLRRSAPGPRTAHAVNGSIQPAPARIAHIVSGPALAKEGEFEQL